MSTAEESFELFNKQLGLRIKEIRTEKGLSLSALSADSNLEKTSISRIENSRTNPTLKTLYQLSNALGVDIIEFFTFPKSSEV